MESVAFSSPPGRASAGAPVSPHAANASTRSSLDSLAELEALLEEQHNQLIARGFIPPTEEAPWRVLPEQRPTAAVAAVQLD